MAQTVYECMMILDPNAYARDPGSAASGITEMIEQVGGTAIVSRLWNEQKLAYPIEGHRKGVYWLTYIQIESTDMPKFNRQCQLNDMIVRHMPIKIDPRLVDTLVSVARGESQQTSRAESNESDSEAKDDEKSDSDSVDAEAETVES